MSTVFNTITIVQYREVTYHDEQVGLVRLLSDEQEEETGGRETRAHGRHGHPQVLLVLESEEIAISRKSVGGSDS